MFYNKYIAFLLLSLSVFLQSKAQPTTFHTAVTPYLGVGMYAIKNAPSPALPYMLPEASHYDYDRMKNGFTPLCAWSFYFKSIQDFLTVKIDRNCLQSMPAFDYTFVFNISSVPGTYISGTPNISGTGFGSTASSTVQLRISYDPASGAKYQDIDVYKFSGAHAFTATLNSILNSDGSPAILSLVPDCIIIEPAVVVEPVDDVPVNAVPVCQSAIVDNNLQIKWDFLCLGGLQATPYPVPRNVQYELEWTYVDDYKWNSSTGEVDNIFSHSSGTINYNFEANASRVRLETNAYSLPVIYERGAIVYRVRAVLPDASDFQKVKYGDWSLPDKGQLNVTNSNLNENAIIISGGHLEGLNWQYSINFAEDGKYKHVINYFDGLLKNHQTQTKINSDPGYIVAVDHAFDYEGRPAITSLPTPIPQISLGYRSDVLLKPGSSAVAISPSDFDSRNNAPNVCIVPGSVATPSLSPGSGSIPSLAERYYSSDNPLNVSKNLHAFVPKSFGFPYIQTVYAPENPGRILVQGGAGPDFQIYAGGHYSINSYLYPGQAEINRILGTEVGGALFHPKVISTDPNGQSSVTISNKFGKPIATYLEGTPPGGTVNTTNTPEDLLSGARQDRSSLQVRFTNKFHLDRTSSPSLDYSVNINPLVLCEYESAPNNTVQIKATIPATVSIDLADECGNPISLTAAPPASGTAPVYNSSFGSKVYPYTGSTPTTYSTPSNILPSSMPKGDYYLTKTLSFQKSDIESVASDHIQDNPYIFSTTTTPTTSCTYNTEEYFIADKVEQAATPCTLPTTNSTGVVDSYCDLLRKKLRDELLPGKKYGQYTANARGQFTGAGANSIFTYTTTTLPNPNGTSTTITDPQNTTVTISYSATISTAPGNMNKCDVYCSASPNTCFGHNTAGCGCTTSHNESSPCCFSCLINHCSCIIFDTYHVTASATTAAHACDIDANAPGVLTNTIIPAFYGYLPPPANITSAYISVYPYGTSFGPYCWIPQETISEQRNMHANCNCGVSHNITEFHFTGGGGVQCQDPSMNGRAYLYFMEHSNGALHCPQTTTTSVYDTPMHTWTFAYGAACLNYPAQLPFNGKLYGNAASAPNATPVVYDIHQLMPDEFIALYNAYPVEIGESLLPLHPEYCKLGMCQDNDFIKKLTNANSFEDAQANGLFDLVDPNTSAYSNTTVYRSSQPLTTLLGQDPLYLNATSLDRDAVWYDALTHLPGYSISLSSGDPRLRDITTIAMELTYCSGGNQNEYDQCRTAIYSNEIANRTLPTDELKQKFWTNLRQLYLTTHLYQRQKAMDAATANTCQPCAAARLTLVQPPALASIFSNTSGPDGQDNLDANYFTIDAASAAELGLDDLYGDGTPGSAPTASQINNLANSAASSAGTNAATNLDKQAAIFLLPIKDQLTAASKYTSLLNDINAKLGALPLQEISPDYINSWLAANNLVGPLCNAYLLDYNLVRTNTDELDAYLCQPQAYYDDVKAFADKLLGTGNSLQLDPANQYENSLMIKLGLSTVSVQTVNFSSISAVSPDNVPTWDFSLQSGSTTQHVFLSQVKYPMLLMNTYSLPSTSFSQAMCLNGQGLMSDGVIAQNTAMLLNGTDRYVLWTSNVPVMAPYSNPDLQRAVTAWDIKDGVSQFVSDAANYGYSIVYNHVYFQNVLTNYLNSRSHKRYTFDEYEALMQGCAISDYVLFPKSIGWVQISLPAGQTYNDLISHLQALGVPSAGNTQYKWRLSSSSIMLDFSENNIHKLYLDLFTVPAQYIQSAYGDLVAQAGAANISVANTVPSNAAATVFIPTQGSPAFTPTIANLYVSVATSATVYQNNSQTPYDRYEISFNSSATSKQRSDALNDLSNYIRSMHPYALVYYQAQLLRSGDYGTTEKNAYLVAAYDASITNHSQAIAAIVPSTMLPAYNALCSGCNYSLSYNDMFCAGKFNNLSVAPATTVSSSNVLYTALSDYGSMISSGTANPSTTSASPHQFKKLIRKANGAYWFVYIEKNPTTGFSHGYTVYNAFILPPYGKDLTGYSIDLNTIQPVQCDVNGNFYGFTVDLNKTVSGGVLTEHCQGYTDFPFTTGGMQIQDVILYKSPTAYCYDAGDCEYQKIQAAIQQGKAAYYDYYNVTKEDLVQQCITFLQDPANIAESLNLGKPDNAYNYTLYFYDRAGNLMRTVPPQGVKPYTGSSTTVDNNRNGSAAQQVTRMVTYNKSTNYTYSSINQPISVNTPDAGTVKLYYDDKGRIAFKQDAVQAAKSTGGKFYYTYTLYDEQSRPVETGEMQFNEPVNPLPQVIADLAAHKPVNYQNDIVVPVKNSNKRDVVHTYYDEEVIPAAVFSSSTSTSTPIPMTTLYKIDHQDNLRGRVSGIKYFAFTGSTATSGWDANPDYALYYSYDAAGNVKTLTHEIKALTNLNQKFKRIDYDYDIISGKVNMVSYNRGFPDQFYHRYSYDADNRIVAVETSHDGVYWAADAKYDYYKHGPLAHLQLGDLSVQSLQYAYTIQGWLKSINGDLLNPNMDMGRDGMSTSGVTDPFARDAIAHDLQYYNGDYSPIGNTAVENITNAGTIAKPLYNGNIARQYTSIASLDAYTSGTTTGYYGLERTYEYDPLNRLIQATNKPIDNLAGALASASASPADLYKMNISYDADGNILTLKRFDRGGGPGTSTAASKLDELTYDYVKSTSPTVQDNDYHNQLQNVNETAGATGVSGDIEAYLPPTGTKTYQYDENGNLVKDQRDGLNITWNLYGKASAIRKTSGTTTNSIYLHYDGLGNRIAKEYVTGTGSTEHHKVEYYLRDASGNILAVYNDEQQYTSGPMKVELTHIAKVGIGSGPLGDVIVQLGQDFTSIREYLSANAPVAAPTWTSDIIGTKSSVFYLQNIPGALDQLVSGTADYLDDLQAYNPGGGATGLDIIASAVNQADNETQGHLLNTVTGIGQPALQPALQYFTDVAPPDQCMQLWNNLGGMYNPGDPTMSVITLTNTIIGAGNAGIAGQNIINQFAQMDQAGLPKELRTNYLSTLFGDNNVFRNPALRSSGGGLTPFEEQLTGFIAQDGDETALEDFFSTWQNLDTWVADNLGSDQKLNVLYADDPQGFVSSLIDENVDVVGDAVAAEVGITPDFYSAKLIWAGVDPGAVEAVQGHSLVSEELSLAEHHIYGSGRLGIQYYDNTVGGTGSPQNSGVKNKWTAGATTAPGTFYNLNNPAVWYSYAYGDLVDKTQLSPWGNWDRNGGLSGTINGAGTISSPVGGFYEVGRSLGYRHYELTDHLGNVLATVLDRKLGSGYMSGGSWTPFTHTAVIGGISETVYDYFNADIATAQDYYPFGMLMPGRTSTSTGRFGFNGQQRDDEIAGTGNHLDFKFRGYDPRLGRFWSVDPLAAQYPWNSTYAFAENRVIDGIDLEGDEYLNRTTGQYARDNTAHIGPPDAAQIQGMAQASLDAYVRLMPQARTEASYNTTYGTMNQTQMSYARESIKMWSNLIPFANSAYRTALGEKVTKGDWGWEAAAFIPVVKILRGGGALIKGTIPVFRDGVKVLETAYKIGNVGHAGSRPYREVIKAIQSGGNFVAKSESEAVNFLKESFPGIAEEASGKASAFGYRIDREAAEAATEGLKQGHTGNHINYYNKETGVKGTIIFE